MLVPCPVFWLVPVFHARLCFSWSHIAWLNCTWEHSVSPQHSNQPHAITRLQATHENLKDDTGSTSTHTVNMRCMSLFYIPYMWLIFPSNQYFRFTNPLVGKHHRKGDGGSLYTHNSSCWMQGLWHYMYVCECASFCASGVEERKRERGHVWMRRVRWGCLIQSQCETVDICAFFPFIMWLGLFCAGLATNLPCSTFSMPLVV